MSTEATIERPDQRMNAGRWLVLAIAIGYLVAGVVYTLLAFQQPTDGWYYNKDDGAIVEFSQGGAGPLRPGDRVIAVAGRAIDAEVTWIAPPPGWQLGATVPYTVVRDGATIELEVPLVRRPAGALLRAIVAGSGSIGNVAGLFSLALGFVVFFLRPRDTAARLLLLILTYYMEPTWGDSPLMQAFYPPILYAVALARIGLWPLLWVMITHLILSFPVRKWPLTRWPRLILATLYGVAVAGPLVAALAGSLAIHIATVIGLAVLMIVAFFGTLAHNLRTVREPMARAQIRWMALGLAGPFVGALLTGLINLLLPSVGPAAGWLYSNVLIALLPLCLGIAITRYRLFDIDVIIRRTLVYSLLTLTLGFVYVGCIVVSRTLVVPLIGGSDVAIVASTLAMAALFFPLRRRIQNLIDKRFYRRKYDAAKVLAAFATTARDETDLNNLTGQLLRVVDETMQPEFVGLWMRDTPIRARDEVDRSAPNPT
jgi:hypothetical protein